MTKLKGRLAPKENREAFFKRLESRLPKTAIEEIDFAYDLAKEAHRPAKRDQGMRYFEHPREGCLIMMDELGLYDRDLIIAFLLHDTCEDTALFGNLTGSHYSYDEFEQKARFRINRLFNSERVTDAVIRLTKPMVDEIRFKTKNEAFTAYIVDLMKNNDAILLKAIDRLHNLRTLPINQKDKIKKQIEETEKVYLPIFDYLSGSLELHKAKLLQLMHKEILRLTQVAEL